MMPETEQTPEAHRNHLPKGKKPIGVSTVLTTFLASVDQRNTQTKQKQLGSLTRCPLLIYRLLLQVC